MSRVLFAWELGANYGHLARDIPIAERLRQTGHDVLFVVRDTRVAAELLGPQGFTFLVAPRPLHPARLAFPPGNYAELLLAEGYGDSVQLLGLVEAWSEALRLYRPQLLVADHAPTALLAALLMEIPTAVCGSGFEIPPNVTPLPSIRPWEDIPVARLMRSEEAVLNSINRVAQRLKQPALGRLGEIFTRSVRVFASFAELDHYGERSGEDYAGVFYQLQSSETVDWPTDVGKCIFAYLRPEVPGFLNALSVLRESGAAVVCVAPGLTKAQASHFSSTHMQVLPRPVAVSLLLRKADVVVGYGSIGFMAESLLAGVPILAIPQTVEQYLCSARLEAIGAGIMIGIERNREDVSEALSSLLNHSSHRHAARAFAEKYREYSLNIAADRVANSLLPPH